MRKNMFFFSSKKHKCFFELHHYMQGVILGSVIGTAAQFM